MKQTNIINIRHPDYADTRVSMYRAIKNNDTDYITKYLYRYSTREGVISFRRRRALAYSPSYAKADVGEVQLSITNRLTDVRRESNDPTYIATIDGHMGGVDRNGSSMNQFIGDEVLSELLYMGKVGVFVDMITLPEVATKADIPADVHPYLYIYTREDILSWSIKKNVLTSLLLYFEEDIEQLGLTANRIKKYRHLELTSDGVVQTIYDSNGHELESVLIDLPQIPFFIAELSQSLLKDVALQQNTLLNLASSDVHYCMESNFPFYTEQSDPAADAYKNLPTDTVAEDAKRTNEEKTGDSKNLDLGPTRGRSYPKGMDRPGFINPSSEPLTASMEKQASIRSEIRTLLHLSLSGVTNAHATADDRGLNYGLKSIGDELEKLERFVMRIWSMYMGTESGTVYYPEDYTLKTAEERLAEAKELLDILKASPSKTFQREMQKKIVALLFVSGIQHSKVEKMLSEIDQSDILFVDPESLINDVEAALVTTETASLIRGYDPGEAAKAEAQRIDRAAATLLAQKRIAASEADDDTKGAARGVKDLEIDMHPGEDSAKIEKDVSQSASVSTNGDKKVRGKA